MKPPKPKVLKAPAPVINKAMPTKLVQGWEVQFAQLDARVDSFEMELRQQGRRQEEGFEKVDRNFAQLFARVEAATTRPIPWAIIVSSVVGIAGLCVTIATALALWANAYFGTSIKAAEARGNEAHNRLEKMSARYESKIERLNDLIWTTRLNTKSSESSPPSLSAPYSPLFPDASATTE